MTTTELIPKGCLTRRCSEEEGAASGCMETVPTFQLCQYWSRRGRAREERLSSDVWNEVAGGFAEAAAKQLQKSEAKDRNFMSATGRQPKATFFPKTVA